MSGWLKEAQVSKAIRNRYRLPLRTWGRWVARLMLRLGVAQKVAELFQEESRERIQVALARVGS